MPAVASAGYSGKPLWQKLGLAGGSRLFVMNPPPHLPALLAGAPSGVVRLPRLGEFDIALAFVTMHTDVPGALARLQPKLAIGGMIWFAWPKQSSGIPTSVTENVLRSLVLPSGLVDVKVCAIDTTSSGLKFVRRRAGAR